MRGQRRHFFRNGLPRRELGRAIFIPLRTRSSMSLLNSTVSQESGVTGTLTEIFPDILTGDGRFEARSSGSNRPRINVSSFFMELTYSSGEPNGINVLKNSSEGQKRRLLEIHAANTLNIIKHYCPAKPHKFNQFRCCVRVQRDEAFDFQSLANKPLNTLDVSQVKCNIKVLVIIREDPSGKWNSSFTPYFVNCLSKRCMNPTCITFQTEALLNALVEQLNDDLHVFPKNSNVNDPVFCEQAKKFLIMSTLAKLVEDWNVPVLVLDSCLSKLIDLEEIVEFCKRFQIKFIDVDANSYAGASKQRRATAKKVRHEIRTALTAINLKNIGGDLRRLQQKMATSGLKTVDGFGDNRNVNAALISEDCKRIVFSLHERMSASLQQQFESAIRTSPMTPQISLLEDEILSEIENSDAFACPRHLQTPVSAGMTISKLEAASYRMAGESGESPPKSSRSLSDDDKVLAALNTDSKIDFSTALVRQRERISELLFNELNQRWRLNGPQRFVAKSGDNGPYCSAMTDSEKQLLISILQEVAYFETLKDIRNELKDSKKDLEGRLYGYNPDFANLIASAEEFLHGKAACMEPCKEEMQFYKMPVSLVMSESEVKYLRFRPPAYIVGQESPSQLIRTAIEESAKLFMDAVIRATCGARKLPFSRRNKTKVIVVVEDNNEALELLIGALWFFEKTPLATFQSKYYFNTAEFLLSLDACRLYFRSYPPHSAKKDEEHVFERWLGLGLNGILRSHQHKILVIDFPRPGTHLQNSKNILVNRLKIEEKLHNIKSFIVGKPSRKEDNLSTVEKVLDEIQKALEPRDKLLFRKSRRMYMDLKLYKQIEQKSRQDLKALREWGLPEPDNEHDLWEKLRNSELVINAMVPSREANTAAESLETRSIIQESESVNPESSCGYEEDTSEPESLSGDYISESKKSSSEDVNFLSDCEESMESNHTITEDHNLVNDEIHSYFTTLRMHANRQSFCESATIENVCGESACIPEDKAIQDTKFQTFSPNENVNSEMSSCCILNSPTTNCIHHHCSSNKVSSEEGHMLNVDSQDFSPSISFPHPQDDSHVKDFATSVNQEKGTEDSVRENENKVKTIKKYSIMDSEIQTDAFTKIEFTLPPGEGFSVCSTTSSSLESDACNGLVRDEPKSSSNVESTQSQKTKNPDPTAQRKNVSMPDLCVAYMSKLGKSLSRTLSKTTTRSRFPPLRSLVKTTKRQQIETDKSIVQSSDTNGVNAKKEQIEDPSEIIDERKRKRNHPSWMHNLLKTFKTKTSKKNIKK